MKEILVVKKDEKLGHQGKVSFKVTKKKNRGYSDTEYVNSIDIHDPEQLANLFNDLRTLFNAPVEKAVLRMRNKKSPFW